MNDATRIKFLDVLATFDGEQWNSEPLRLADILNSTLPTEGFSASDPHPHATAVKLAQALMPDLEVITLGEPYDEEEGPISSER